MPEAEKMATEMGFTGPQAKEAVPLSKLNLPAVCRLFFCKSSCHAVVKQTYVTSAVWRSVRSIVAARVSGF